MSYKMKTSNIFCKLIKCMDNNDIFTFLNILNKNPNFDIEHHDKETGHTLLTYACGYGLFDFIKVLIENKDADVNDCNSLTHDSPLHFATSANNGVILKLLISNEADIYLLNNDGYNAMEYALFMNHMISYHEFKKILSATNFLISRNEKPKKKKKHNVSKSSNSLSSFFRGANSKRPRSESQKQIFETAIMNKPPPFIKSMSEGIHRQNSASPLNSTKHSYAKRDMRNNNKNRQNAVYRIVHPNYQTKSINSNKINGARARHTLFSSFGPQQNRSQYACVQNTHKSYKKHREFNEKEPEPEFKEKEGHNTSNNCKSCRVLYNEADILREERDILQEKVTKAIHALVLQKELVRKQNIELKVLRIKLQRTQYTNIRSISHHSERDEKDKEDMETHENAARMFSFPWISISANDEDDCKSVDKEKEKEEEIKSPGAAPFSKRLLVNLEQSVTAVVDEQKSSSPTIDSTLHEEEFIVMEGKEGVKMTNSENTQTLSMPTPLQIESVFSFDGGIDDDLLINLHQNTPTPLSARANDLDEKSTNDYLHDDAEENKKTQRWKVFETSEFAQLFCVLQYRTYCYCQREKRTSLMLKQMISNDDMYLMKMEELHSSAITEELNILKPIFHIETLSNFLRNLVETEHDLDGLFAKHEECHDIIYKSIKLHLRSTGIVYKTDPVFNWYISDYQQMWIYQELFYNNFETFLVNICGELHNANIYCCHKNDFDEGNRYKHKIDSFTSMVSKYKRTKQNINDYYAKTFGDDFNKRDTVFCSPKNASRSFFKVFYDFDGNVSHLTDFLRASFVFDNFEDLYNALFVIHNFCGILKFKNSFLSDAKLNNGWRQIIINVPLCCDSVPNYIICEIQLHFCLFWQFKDATHTMYEVSRLFKIRDHKTGKSKNLAMQCAKQFYSK